MSDIDLGVQYKNLISHTAATTNNYLLVRSYFHSITEQEPILTNDPDIQSIVKKLNDSLFTIKQAVSDFVENTDSKIPETIQDLLTFLYLHLDILRNLPTDITDEDANYLLNTMSDKAISFQTKLSNISKDITDFSLAILAEVTIIAAIIPELNAMILGDNSELSDITREISSLQTQLDTAIALAAASAAAMIGGIFLIIFGIVSIFAGGTALIAGGIGLLTLGVAGETTERKAIADLQDQKKNLLEETSTLSQEVLLSTAIKTALESTFTLSEKTSTSCSLMADSWSLLSSDFNELSDDLINATVNTGIIREMFIITADEIIESCINDALSLKLTLSGTQILESDTQKDDLLSIFPKMFAHLL